MFAAESHPSVRRLYHHCPQSFLFLGFAVGLFAGPEGQRFGELNRNAAKEPAHVIHPTDTTGAGEACHIEAVCWSKPGDTETRRYFLTLIRAVFVSMAGKGRSSAADIDHLSLRKCFVEVLGEPDWPVVTQSLLLSALDSSVHCKSPKNLLFSHCLRIGRFEGLLYKPLPGKSPLFSLIGRIWPFLACNYAMAGLSLFAASFVFCGYVPIIKS